MMKLSELGKSEKVVEYKATVNEKWEGVRVNVWRGVEEHWVSFRKAVNRSAVEVCEMKRVRGRGIKREERQKGQ